MGEKRLTSRLLYTAVIAGLIVGYSTAKADETVWQDISSAEQNASISAKVQNLASSATLPPKSDTYRLLALDESRLKSQLLLAGSEKNVISGITISLPLPDGTFAVVEATPVNILSPELANKNPELRAWNITGKDGKVRSGVVDFTSLGFHGMVDLANGQTIFIDPDNNGLIASSGQRNYASYAKRSNAGSFVGGRKCGLHGKNSFSTAGSFLNNLTNTGYAAKATVAAKAGETLHTYRLAVATTAEYTRDIAGGNVNTANSRIFSLVNRINQIYQRDLAIRFQLVGGTRIIQTNIANDGYSNNDGLALLSENQIQMDRLLGNNGYDIGHVLSTGGIGYGEYNTPCNPRTKARGTSALSPSGTLESDALDMVGHELGHQFTADHTFNGIRGDCGVVAGANPRSPLSAIEPGAGSTIMSYAGNCGTDNLMPLGTGASVLSMFHSHSIRQIINYAHNGYGATCAVKTSLGNRNPVVTAGNTYNIPAQTPFTLKPVSVVDPDGNGMTYAWEQINVGAPSIKNIDLGNNALIRAQLPVAGNDTRTIPSLPDLLGSKRTDGEILPIRTRTLNFRLTARDNRGGVGFGDVRVNVVNRSPAFTVTTPNTVLRPNGKIQITWNVARTNEAPISCPSVDISIINSSGVSYQNLGRHPNNGISPLVQLATSISSGSRIKVACSNNIFFAISGTAPFVASLQ